MRARHTGGRVTRELECHAKGPARWCEISVVPLGPEEYVILVRDNTERRRAEEHANRLAAAVEQAADAVVITDISGTIQYVNPAFEQIFGFTRAEVIGRNPAMLKSGRHDSEFYRRLWEAILSGRVWQGRFTDRRKDETVVELNTTISPVRDPAGRIANFVAVSHDTTREIELQDQLRQSQKMEAIGRLAGGIARDFNNVLTSILGNVDLILRRMSQTAELRDNVEQIRDAAQRAAAMVAQLLTFSRKQVVYPRVISINDAVESMTRLLSRIIGNKIRMETHLEPQAGWIRIDPVQFEQVIMNLVLNARDAMPNGGLLRLATSVQRVDDSESAGDPDLPPDLYATLTVSDTGHGMDEKIQARIFEPFFTTKEFGQGTGLGLSIVYGIVRQSGGAIRVQSAPAKGTIFTIYFPKARAEAEGVSLPTEPGAPRTVLIVDDEPAVGKLAARILMEQGFLILQALNGQEAIDILRRNRSDVALLLTDLVMPKMDGLRLAELVRKERPTRPIVFMSGHPETIDFKPEDWNGTFNYVRKPFRADQLLDAVARAFDSVQHVTTQ